MPSIVRDVSFPSQNKTIDSIDLKNGNQTIFKRIGKGFVRLFKDRPDSNRSENDENQSTFRYDPELDIREEQLNLLSKQLLNSLREGKIKHLSCDNLFLPCNHIRNIARQCLIMSAEEPFGLMGAQIKIKLSLSSKESKILPLIRLDPKQKTIFEIEIELHEDTKILTLRRLLPEMKVFQWFKEKSPLYVSPRCLLIKRVFYKTAEPKRATIDS